MSEEQILVVDREVFDEVGSFQGLQFDTAPYIKKFFKDGVPHFMDRAKVFVQILENYSAELPNYGLSDADVVDLSEKLVKMRDSYTAQKHAIEKRETAAQERNKQFALLYAEFTKYCLGTKIK